MSLSDPILWVELVMLSALPFLVAGGLATAAFGGHLAPPVRALLVWIKG